MTPPASAGHHAPGAERYIFRYLGDEVWLVDRRLVHTVAPLSAPLVELAGRSGFWCELRDAEGRPVHRQVLRDPRHPAEEVPGRLRQVPRAAPAGVFTVLVPATGGAGELALIQRRATDEAPRDVFTVRVEPPPVEPAP